jgi:hypothetical protein
MNGKVKILFFCMVFVAGHGFSQKSSLVNEQNLLLSTIKKIKQQQKTTPLALQNKPVKNKPATYTYIKNLPIITSNYYTNNLGFFCKKELAFEKATKLPFKLRLGSVEQCDYLEGKNIKH